MDKMITRDEAIVALYEIIDNPVIDEELRDKMLDIANLIEIEKAGMHFWGGNLEEYHEMVVSRRSDMWTDEAIAKADKIQKEHSFEPAPYEKAEIEENLKELAE